MMQNKRKVGLLLICLLTVGVASVYAQEGKPFEGLNELWDAIFGVQEDIEDIQATLALHLEIAELKARVALLEAAPPGGGTPGPAGPQGPSGPQGETGPPGSDADCTELEAQITSLYSEYLALESAIITAVNSLTIQHSEDIAFLQGQIDALEAAPAGLGVPSHDSGWQDAWNQIQMEFWFSTEDVPDYTNSFVYMELKKSGEVIHNIGYGGLGPDIPYPSEGIYWEMDNLVKVYLSPSHLYDYVRIRIWQLPPPTP